MKVSEIILAAGSEQEHRKRGGKSVFGKSHMWFLLFGCKGKSLHQYSRKKTGLVAKKQKIPSAMPTEFFQMFTEKLLPHCGHRTVCLPLFLGRRSVT